MNQTSTHQTISTINTIDKQESQSILRKAITWTNTLMIPQYAARGISARNMDIHDIHPFAFIFVNNKYIGQMNCYNKIKQLLIITDLKSGAIWIYEQQSKSQNGESIRDFISQYQLNKNTLPTTIITDGCGSMLSIKNVHTLQKTDHPLQGKHN